jgi:putative sterol carrier protein
MSEVVNAAVEKLSEKIDSFDSTAKFVITGEGAIMIDEGGVRPAEDGEEADVTLTASRETFEGIMDGSVNPTTAFMTGKLALDGSMAVAMQLGQKLS